MRERKRITPEKYRKIIGFRPSAELIPILRRLDSIPHARRSWLFNQAMLRALPAIIDQLHK